MFSNMPWAVVKCVKRPSFRRFNPPPQVPNQKAPSAVWWMALTRSDDRPLAVVLGVWLDPDQPDLRCLVLGWAARRDSA